MGYFSDMSGLSLFEAPFCRTQTVRSDTPKTQQPVSAPQKPKTPSLAQPAGNPHPPKPAQPRPGYQEAEPDRKSATQQTDRQVSLPETVEPPKQQPDVPKQETQAPPPPEAQALQPPEQSVQPEAQPRPPKEMVLDMSADTGAGTMAASESDTARRKAHEEAEAKRKAEWDAKQLAKKQAQEATLQKLQAMSDEEAIAASAQRINTDVERLTRRNMKECVAEHIQALCRKDAAFARRTMHPHKSMVHCFQYINRMAKDYIQQEMKDNGMKPENGVYGGDVPDGLCYQWGVDYFNDMDAPEDQEKEEKFTPRPYAGAPAKTAASAEKAAKSPTKAAKKKSETTENYEQMSFMKEATG